jgi:hypothetical protein
MPLPSVVRRGTQQAPGELETPIVSSSGVGVEKAVVEPSLPVACRMVSVRDSFSAFIARPRAGVSSARHGPGRLEPMLQSLCNNTAGRGDDESDPLCQRQRR